MGTLAALMWMPMFVGMWMASCWHREPRGHYHHQPTQREVTLKEKEDALWEEVDDA